MHALKRLNDACERALLVVGTFLFSVLIIVVFLQVVTRRMGISWVWTHEIALICFIWTVFLGGAIAVRLRRHYIVELLPARMLRANAALDVFGDVMIFIVLYVFIFSGWEFALLGLRRATRVLQLPQTILFLAFPVSGVFMALFGIENLIASAGRLLGLSRGGKHT